MEKSHIKHTQFRAWKSGKNWLYTSTALAVVAAGAAFGGKKASADALQDVQNQITLQSLTSDASATQASTQSVAASSVVVTKTEAVVSSQTTSLDATQSSQIASLTSSLASQSLTSSQASALSAFTSGLSANPELSSVFGAINSAAATSSGSAVMASLAASMGSNVSGLVGQLSSALGLVANVTSASNAVQSAISAATGTSEYASLMSGLNAISEDATISNAVAAISSASAAGNSDLAASLASSFFTTTSEGSEIISLQNSFAATSAGQVITAAESALANVTDSVSKTLSSLVVTKSDGTYSFLGMTGDIADYLMSVVGATLGYAAGMFGGHLISIPFGLLVDLLGFIGVAPLNAIGLTIPGWFGQIGAGYLAGVGTGFTGYVMSTIGSTLGGWYGATNMFQGLNTQSSTLIETLAGVGADIGGFLAGGVGAVIVTLLNHLWWISMIPGAFMGIIPFVAFIEAGILAILIPFTAEGGMMLVQGVLGTIGAFIGALIGGAIGWIAQAFGLNINIPTFTSALGWLLNVSGLGGLITQIIKPAATGSISVTNQTVANGTAFKPSSLLVSATDSNGSTVDLSTVTYTGTVIPTHSGTYAIQFSFTDSDGSTVTQTALWTVQAKGTASAANIAEAVVTNKTTGSESLKVTNTTLVVGQAYRAASAFVSATDSEGNAVPASAITVAGTVVSSKAGVYPVVYSFTDPYTGDVVSQTALVTVTPATKVVTA